jgi:FG-GAP repeat
MQALLSRPRARRPLALGRAYAVLIALVAALGGLLLAAPTVLAANFSWSGEGSASANTLSNSANWSGVRVQRVRLLPWRALVLALVLALLAGSALSTGSGSRDSFGVVSASRSDGLSRRSLLSLPVAAQGPVSAALGANGGPFTVSERKGALSASNSVQRLSADFTRSGIVIRSGSTHVSLGLVALGYGSSRVAVNQVAPRAHANRVIYQYPQLTEWYANGPLGFEQGFTLRRAYARSDTRVVDVVMALSGNGAATVAEGGRSLVVRHGAKTILRYTDLVATDAHGRQLPSRLELHRSQLVLRVDTHDASYPIRIDPLIEQGAKLTGGEETGGEDFGFSVALSSDGNTALIGGYGEQNNSAGAAWVFTRSGSTWTQQGKKLTGGEEVGVGMFGWRVALSSDGNTALIGGPGDHGGGSFAQGRGAAWVFTRSGSTWTQQGKKIAPTEEAATGFFGVSVALSGDGNTALVGCACGNLAGAAVAYTRSGSTWMQQGGPLTGGEESGAGYFGWSVALSENGNTALIGGAYDNSSAGAAWVFTRSGSTWSQQGKKLTGSEESGAGAFGSSVALSTDGNTALIGGDGDNSYVGAAWVFTRSGSTWSQQGKKLTGGEESGKAAFSGKVALSADGNTALIGGSGDNEGVGAAWVFTRSGSTWSQQGKKLTGKEEVGKGAFGTSVALSSEGNTALLGGEADNSYVGAAWAFTPGVVSEEEHHEEHKEESKGGGSPGGGGTGGSQTGGNSTSPGSGSGGTISTAQLMASLAPQLVPSGKGAKIASLLKSGGVALPFTALEAGTVTVQWYLVPHGAKLATKAKPILVASGKLTFSGTGTGKIKLKLTVAGKRLLKHAKRLKLTAKGTFTSTGGMIVSASRQLLLTR